MSYHFRNINKDDFNHCTENLVTAYNGEPWNNTWTKKEALRRIEATMSGFNSRGYFVEKEEQIIAICLGRIDYYYDNWSQFCVDEFHVTPNQQGKGIGKKLLKFTSEMLQKEDVNQIFLITGGEQAAIFYQKSGFLKLEDGTAMAYDLKKKEFSCS